MKRFFITWLLSILTLNCFAAERALALSDAQIQLLKSHLPSTKNDEPLIWKGDSIRIDLPIGKEKRLVFSEPIQADLTGNLTTSQLRIINNDQSLYLTAQQAFTDTRMYVTLKNSQTILLLDIVTNPNADNTARRIVILPQKAEAHMMNTEDQLMRQPVSADDFVAAIRFVWQQLYAPERLIQNLSDFTRTPMHTDTWAPNLMYGNKVFAHPQASWIRNGLYVTVIELRNKYPHSAHIQLERDLCGNWQAATLYPRSYLKAVGNKTSDSTTLFLISNQSFSDAMQVCDGRA